MINLCPNFYPWYVHSQGIVVLVTWNSYAWKSSVCKLALFHVKKVYNCKVYHKVYQIWWELLLFTRFCFHTSIMRKGWKVNEVSEEKCSHSRPLKQISKYPLPSITWYHTTIVFTIIIIARHIKQKQLPFDIKIRKEKGNITSSLHMLSWVKIVKGNRNG